MPDLQEKQSALAASLDVAETRRRESIMRRKVRRRKEQDSALRIGVGMVKKAGAAREALLKKKAEAIERAKRERAREAKERRAMAPARAPYPTARKAS